MKSIVFDMPKFSLLLFISCFLWGILGTAQQKNERESRVTEKEIPENALILLKPYLEDAKRLRYYQESDGDKRSFEVKFKKGKLRYSVEFSPEGKLEDVEFLIKSTDIPDETWEAIQSEFQKKFSKTYVKKIQQQYPSEGRAESEVLKEAFQNLILPYIRYELVVAGKNQNHHRLYEILFDAKGELLLLREFAPTNYDHVLY
ncbi:MAG: hypothetical protein AAF090_05710 [Bacteroidota bacterium]